MRFVIICPSRTGSTMLRMSLSRHPAISCHGEILAQTKARGLNGRDVGLEVDEVARLHAEDPAELVRRSLGATPARGKTAFGFKIIYRQIPPRQAIVDSLAADPGIALVHLWRRDLCDRFISHKKHAAAGRARAVELDITLDPAELVADVAAQTRARAEVLAMFAGHAALEVTYEDLVGAGNANAVVRFLGLEGEAPLADRQEAPGRPVVTVANEAELRAAYAAL
jgi:hypothetical protein